MFLFIFEDGLIKKATVICDGDKSCADDGIIDLIDISGDEPKQYYDGEWHDLESANA